MFSQELLLPRNIQINKAPNKEYLSSERWKCEKSPSGAHHWIVRQCRMTCKYCCENRLVQEQNSHSEIHISLIV
jgi:hypothetical protein